MKNVVRNMQAELVEYFKLCKANVTEPSLEDAKKWLRNHTNPVDGHTDHLIQKYYLEHLEGDYKSFLFSVNKAYGELSR